jgi:hypothetical protein
MELKIRPATIADLDAVNHVEASTFPPAEACTYETIRYRLTAMQHGIDLAPSTSTTSPLRGAPNSPLCGDIVPAPFFAALLRSGGFKTDFL